MNKIVNKIINGLLQWNMLKIRHSNHSPRESSNDRNEKMQDSPARFSLERLSPGPTGELILRRHP